jgi:hypothetical protein
VFFPDVPLNELLGQRGGGGLVELGRELVHPLPRHEERRRDDQHDRRPEQELAFGRQGDAKLANPFEQPSGILSARPGHFRLRRAHSSRDPESAGKNSVSESSQDSPL